MTFRVSVDCTDNLTLFYRSLGMGPPRLMRPPGAPPGVPPPGVPPPGISNAAPGTGGTAAAPGTAGAAGAGGAGAPPAINPNVLR